MTATVPPEILRRIPTLPPEQTQYARTERFAARTEFALETIGELLFPMNSVVDGGVNQLAQDVLRSLILGLLHRVLPVVPQPFVPLFGAELLNDSQLAAWQAAVRMSGYKPMQVDAHWSRRVEVLCPLKFQVINNEVAVGAKARWYITDPANKPEARLNFTFWPLPMLEALAAGKEIRGTKPLPVEGDLSPIIAARRSAPEPEEWTGVCAGVDAALAAYDERMGLPVTLADLAI